MTTTKGTTSSPEQQDRAHADLYQIDPSDGYAYYQILDGASVLAEIVATRHPDSSGLSGMLGGTEYWKISTIAALRASAHSSLSVKRVRSGKWLMAGAPPFKAADASFTVPVNATWGGPAMVTCERAASSDEGFDVDLSPQSGQWRGTMRFYSNSRRPMFKTIANGATEVFQWSTYRYRYSCVIQVG